MRRAQTSLRQVFFGAASSLTGVQQPFSYGPSTAEQDQTRPIVPLWNDQSSRAVNSQQNEPWTPKLVSLENTNVSELVLIDVDLQCCRFAGAHHLDKLSIEGDSWFGLPPAEWRVWQKWPPVWHWTRRRVLAEENAWRTRGQKDARWQARPPSDSDDLGPERLVVLYRSLRKALEDSKNEAGAGDFYYGEMEARRRAKARRHAKGTSKVESLVLTAYWLISGYGQRANRALAGLLVLVAALTVLLTGWGLSQTVQVQQVMGTVQPAPAGQPQMVDVQVRTPPAVLPPPDQRWTAARAERAVRIALGSVVFRDTDQRLTTAGSWMVMTGRALGPILLALAVLAIRARVKR
jgi:hypothetical protein